MFNRILAVSLSAVLVVAPLSAQHIFSDGFENGTTSRWSSAQVVHVTTTSGPVGGHPDRSEGYMRFDLTATQPMLISKLFDRNDCPGDGGFCYEVQTSNGTPYLGGFVGLQVVMGGGTPTNDTVTHFVFAAGETRTIFLYFSLDNNENEVGPPEVAGSYRFAFKTMTTNKGPIVFGSQYVTGVVSVTN